MTVAVIRPASLIELFVAVCIKNDTNSITTDDITAYLTEENIEDDTFDNFDTTPEYKKYLKKNKLVIPKEVIDNVQKTTTTVYPFTAPPKTEAKLEAKMHHSTHIPLIDANYVAWGHHNDLKEIIQSKVFFPVWIPGLSGNGKTFTVLQVCAELGREVIRVNIDELTDETDLIGSYTLVGGNTVWQHGPVVNALMRGAILLLDEIDLGTSKIMCLQSILEGNGVFIKKISQYIPMTPGFNIIATANTKGQGDITNKFISTNVHNEAMLERFVATMEQSYPPKDIESQILYRYIYGMKAPTTDKPTIEKMVSNLIDWAVKTRDNHISGIDGDIITTRRLCHIIKTWGIFGDIDKAIDMCISRFTEDSKGAMKDTWNKISKDEVKPATKKHPYADNPHAIPA